MYKFTVSPYCQINNSDKKSNPSFGIDHCANFLTNVVAAPSEKPLMEMHYWISCATTIYL